MAELADRRQPSTDPAGIRESRLDRLQKASAALSLDAALVTSDESIAYLTGFKPNAARAVLRRRGPARPVRGDRAGARSGPDRRRARTPVADVVRPRIRRDPRAGVRARRSRDRRDRGGPPDLRSCPRARAARVRAHAGGLGGD